MPRTKNYLRYVHESTFGIVAASQVGVSIKYLQMRDSKDKFVAVPANEDVLFWDLKTRQVINKLPYDDDIAAEVTVLECFHGGHPRTNLIAVGYANGRVRLFEYETGMLKATFTGHRVAITALAFDKDGSRLASGGKDSHVVLWDIVGERGMFSLRGHKNSITKLAFLYNAENQKDLLVSSSIDAVSTVKFWDLQLQHCFCTLPGHSSGVWSFALLKDGTRLVTGSTSPELKVYSIRFLSEQVKQSVIDQNRDDDENETNVKSEIEYGVQVRPLGSILRNTIAISNRVQDLAVDPEGSLLVCHSTDKNIELYGLRSNEEALTYAKKQVKKAARKVSKRKRAVDGEEDDTVVDEEVRPVTSLSSLDPQKLVDCEFNRKLGFQKLPDKVRALDVVRMTKKDGAVHYKLAVASTNNKIDCFIYEPPSSNQESTLNQNTSIESMSHRSDVRCVAISSDNTLIMSASGESSKLWRLDSRACIATVETDYATCCTFANAVNLATNYHRNKFAFLGTKQGHLQILDTVEAKVCGSIKVCDNDKPLNSICVLPDQSGLVCGGEDGIVRFFNYVWKDIEGDDENNNQTTLSLEESRTLSFQEGITCVAVSANNKFIAVSLLDSTVRVHFVDTFKYFLTMYGHKFPVTTMDISDDSTLLVTGSPDKNIKIWGLDFGDCHKSIFAHDDAITCVKFVPKTHHVFSCARDRQVKQWDCDIFIKIQTLRKHMAEIWCLAISSNGKFIVTGSHDKSIRLFRKTEEILVPSEEEETERELEDERNVYEKQENIVLGEKDHETGFAAKMTIETVKSTDRLLEAIDVFESEQEKEREYIKLCELADSKNEPRPAAPEQDPLLMTVMATDYHRFLLEVLRRIKSSELEEILLTLPFDYVRKLLTILVIFLEKGWDVELVVRCATFLLKVNFGQITASPTLSQVVYKLKTFIIQRTKLLREYTGFNMIAWEHLGQNRKYQSSKVLRALY